LRHRWTIYLLQLKSTYVYLELIASSDINITWLGLTKILH
jgi:hypothetical protein